jgi:hypothetical protein
VGDIASVIALAKPENGGEPATADEISERLQIAGLKNVNRKPTCFLRFLMQRQKLPAPTQVWYDSSNFLRFLRSQFTHLLVERHRR